MATSNPKRNVVAMKWGELYSADYVNVLYQACRRNISGDFRFICLTDNADGIVADVECFPIPEIGLDPADHYTKAVWPKLALFGPSLYDIEGRILFIDLDMIILGSLDDFFIHSNGLVCTDMGEGWRPGFPDAPPETGTCIFAFDAGQEAQILARFQENQDASMASALNEQEFVGKWARSVDYWPKDWVISFKRFLRQPIGLDLFLSPKTPPPGTRVVAFHGLPRPSHLIGTGVRFWDRFPHMGNGQVHWVRDYWASHGGHLP